MDLIIAILVWLGVIAPGEDVTPDMIQEHRMEINQATHNPQFQAYQNTYQYNSGHIVMTDLQEW